MNFKNKNQIIQLITLHGRICNQSRLKIQKTEPVEELSKVSSQIITHSLCTQKGGMETVGGNGVNPGYRTRKISAEVSQGQSHQRNKQKNLEICIIKKTKRL